MTTFDLDDRTTCLLSSLQDTFGVRTNAGVMRKALALADIVSQYAAPDRTITITTPDGKCVKITLAE